jgi:phosphohistidine phosphatase
VGELVVVRHAIAEHRDPGRWPDDTARPLTADGAERFARAARGLRRIVPEIDAVLASPHARAWQTAEILEREAGWPGPEPCAALAAASSAGDALAAVRELTRRRSVAVVGHEPQLSMLVSLLVGGDSNACALELKKGAAALVAFTGDPAPGRAVLRWSASPRMLRALAR